MPEATKDAARSIPGAARGSFIDSRFTGIILIVGVSLRILSSFLSANNGGDAWAREGITATWLSHPSLKLNFDAWLPFHFWLMGGLAAILGDNVRLAGRLLSFLAGTASLFVFYKLLRTLYNDSAAQIGLTAFALYSLGIAYSSTSSSEAVYLLFVLLGLLGYFRYRESCRLSDLAFSGVFFSFGAATRYEAWSLIFAIGLLLVFSTWKSQSEVGFLTSLRSLVTFSLTAGFFPVIIMAHNWIAFHHLLYAVTMNHDWVAEQLAFSQTSLAYRLLLFPGVLLLTLTPIVVCASVYGFVLSFRTRIGAEFAFLTIFFTAVQFYQIASGGEMAFARYTITLGTFLIILGAHGLAVVFQKFPNHSAILRQSFAAVLLLNLLAIWAISSSSNHSSEKFASISPVLRYAHRIDSLAAFLRPRLNSEDRLVIDDYNSESNIVAQALGLPLPAKSRAFLASIRPASELPGYVESEHPRFIIYAQRGILSKTLVLGCDAALALPKAEVRCPYQNDVYKVYEVIYK